MNDQDECYHILYTTFILMTVFVLLWVLFNIFNKVDKEATINILEEMNKSNY